MSDDTNNNDDDWLLADESEAPHFDECHPRTYRVLIVDDDIDVHAVVRLALKDVSFKWRDLEIFSAYSGEEGFQMMSDTANIALIILDLVMETDDAGLLLAKRIREELGNNIVQIILRTGQPGQAPEQRVIIEYDIRDYKAKTELTTRKLFTSVIASLRTYEVLLARTRTILAFKMMQKSFRNLYKIHSLGELASAVLCQLSANEDVGTDGILCILHAKTGENDFTPRVIAATGMFAHLLENQNLPKDFGLFDAVHRTLHEKRSQWQHPIDIMYVKSEKGDEFAFVVAGPWVLTESQHDSIETYCTEISEALTNIALFKNSTIPSYFSTYSPAIIKWQGILISDRN